MMARDVTPGRRVRLPDGSRSISSPWVWRGFAVMALVALGLCITFFSEGRIAYGAAWVVITLGWSATAAWLWRKHLIEDDAR